MDRQRAVDYTLGVIVVLMIVGFLALASTLL